MIINCLNCGKDIRIKPSLAEKRKYCSKECLESGRRKYDYKDKKCLVCNKIFHFSSKNPDQILCSRKCASKYNAYNVNENFFAKINSEASAYMLGLMLSDGNVASKEQKIHIGD